MRYAIVLALAVLLAAAACGGEETQLTPTPQPAASGTPTPVATAVPTPTASPWEPVAFDQPKLVFTRGQEEWGSPGTLWASNLDGSGERRLTPEGVAASFAGLANDAATAQPLFYYVSVGGEKARTLWRLDLRAGKRSDVFRFESRRQYDFLAAVSPAGRYAAYDDYDSISLLDLLTGETRRILAGNAAGCDAFAIGGCFTYHSPAWSPDGRLLAAQKIFYEGGISVVVDPFAEQPAEVLAGHCCARVWSPGSDAICSWGVYAGASGVYVARAPDWQEAGFLTEYEVSYQPGVPYPDRTVTSCSWLADGRVVVATAGTGYAGPATSDIRILDPQTGTLSVVATFDEGEAPWSRAMVGQTGGPHVVTQGLADGTGAPLPPVAVDVLNGSVRPVLTADDHVVAVVSP